MSGPDNCLTIDVDELRKGMYVREPDRPWVELPFSFQGFLVQTDEELQLLRRYCKHVYVDPERCADSVNEESLLAARREDTVRGDTTHDPERPAGRKQRPANDGIEESRRHVDVEKLKPQMEVASRAMSHANRFMQETISKACRGDGIDMPAARSAISELIVRLTRNPTASLLLTSLCERDSFTSTHSVHSCVLMLALCLRARLDDRKLEIMGLGALLHDMGKANLPEELINRPGPLSEDEWALVKRHPIDSHDILADSGRTPREVLKIARMHHERRDGKGYPAGLTLSDLPDYVLATALVNRYQSLTSTRPYRAAVSPDKVLQSFYGSADAMYGSRPVESFIRCVGIYPVGSVVELDNGALAVVVSSRPSSRLRPCVQLVRTPDDRPYEKLVLLNLAAEAERGERHNGEAPVRKVRRVRNPADTGIDPGAVIAESFGVQIGSDTPR